MMGDFRKVDEIVSGALRGECRMLLAQCTEKQQQMFALVFPGGIDALSDLKLKQAIQLCQRRLAIRTVTP